MNKLLTLKMNFNKEKNLSSFRARNLTKSRSVSSEKILQLISKLEKVVKYYENNQKFVADVLVDVCYNDIICKSGRIQEILKGKEECNDTIVGARFSNSLEGDENHIITHYVSMSVVEDAIKKLNVAYKFVHEKLNDLANSDNFDSELDINYAGYDYSKTKIRDIIIDCSVIDSFGVPDATSDITNETMIVTFFETEKKLSELLTDIGLNDKKTLYYEFAAKNTIIVSKETLEFLKEKIPYLISMTAIDFSKIVFEKGNSNNQANFYISDPHNEPTIGVIDTLFDNDVYFSKWVDYRETLNEVEKYMKTDDDYLHGTSVTSLIVDGPQLNPWLEDGCGRFRVRHFGVCTHKISASALVKKIEEIIASNLDIHVWNLSLGTNEETSKNFISFDAAALDNIEEKYNVIFVVAGTNDTRIKKDRVLRVGSPADSINSIVVNSVRKDGTPASYSRNGKVLSFFNKPDISYYGGDFEDEERIIVCTSNNILDKQYGTSFAAPWVSRKVCYLIDVLGFSRELAKALLIDSAANWNYKINNYKYKNIIGYGILPKNIMTIVQSDNSEIKFTLSGIANTYKTSNYAIPVPKDDDKCFYIARATLCYFPECNRLQGVDYTQRELSLKFGIVSDDGIKDINYNTQEDYNTYNDERKSRIEFRKWENTKFVSSLLRDKNIKGKKTGKEGFWGISLTSKERRKQAHMDDLNFGLVITLKNAKGLNHIDEFKHACLLRGYIINEVDVKNSIDIYNSAQEDIKFE